VQLEQEISRARRKGNSLAVLLCDLNGFKNVNDKFGHLVGNKLLQEIAQNFKNDCREYDHVGRLGGDEFVFVLPEFTKDRADELKPRLERAVQAAGLSVCHEKVVTGSIGCAVFPADGDTPEELLAEADRRMYESKEDHYLKLGDLTRIL
jgi:diguanylate cyclase (GGDEF)-like protein